MKNIIKNVAELRYIETCGSNGRNLFNELSSTILCITGILKLLLKNIEAYGALFWLSHKLKLCFLYYPS